MYTEKSPGGSIYPYYFKGGYLFGLHYGSFHDDEAGLLARMRAEEEFMDRPNRSFPLWVDFYETRLTDPVLLELLQSTIRLRKHIIKLAIVGCSVWDRWRLRRLARRAGLAFPCPVRFFDDPEVAKSWLVGAGPRD